MDPVKLIVDTDPGVDDVLALLLLLASPEIQLEAITVTFGNTVLPKAHENVLKLYQVLDKHTNAHPEDAARFPNFRRQDGHRPVLAKGATGPLEGSLNLAEYFHGPDGLSDLGRTHPEYQVDQALWSKPENEFLRLSDSPAEDLILDILATEHEHSVLILALGPLTNLSRAIQKAPKTFARVKRVICMGGALDVPGNTGPVQEFNFFADASAVQIVLDAVSTHLFPFVLIPLDVTGKHTVPFDRLVPRDAGNEEGVLEGFVSAMLRRPRLFYKKLGLEDAFEMHDPLAAWYAIRMLDEKGWKTNKRKFIIERQGEHTKGMCVVDRRGTGEDLGTIRAADGVDLSITNESTIQPQSEGGVDVVSTWPDPSIFVEELMRRVFWYSTRT